MTGTWHETTLGELADEGRLVIQTGPFRSQLLQRLIAQLNEQFAESRKLEKAIRSNLEGLGYGG